MLTGSALSPLGPVGCNGEAGRQKREGAGRDVLYLRFSKLSWNWSTAGLGGGATRRRGGWESA